MDDNDRKISMGITTGSTKSGEVVVIPIRNRDGSLSYLVREDYHEDFKQFMEWYLASRNKFGIDKISPST